jgi:hypothetical protein
MKERNEQSKPQDDRRPAWRLALMVVVPTLILAGIGYLGGQGTFTFGDSLGLPEEQTEPQPEVSNPDPEPEPEKTEDIHVELPEEVRGIYWTAGTAGSARGDELLEYINDTTLNSVVVDVKMDNGALAFEPNDDNLKKYMADEPAIGDLDGVLQKLKDANVYRIARIPVMRDTKFAQVHPDLAFRYAGGAFWRDNTGAIWVDPASDKVSDYALDLAREAYKRGFDEVQFDYVRFASDGQISAIQYPAHDPQTETKVEVMQRFFEKTGGTLQNEGIPVSYDLFGMTFWNKNDFNIGQRLLDVYPHADFISPMVYPSHYPDGFYGHANPALAPYWIVNESLNRGAQMMKNERDILEEESRPKLRPWIQDFDIGAVYTPQRIRAQIDAARDAGASGWMLWNARNVYEPTDYGVMTQDRE